MAQSSLLAPPAISAANREQGFKNLSSGRVHYRLEGEGPFLVMNHGYGANLHMWAWQREALGRHYRMLTWDMPGFGKSDGIQRPHTVEDFARVQAELMESLGIEEAHVMGLSLGGMVALPFAAMFPHLTTSLILCDTIATRVPAAGRFIFSLYEFRANLTGKDVDWTSRLEHLDQKDKSRFGIPLDERRAHLRILSSHDDGMATARAAQVVSKKGCYNWALAAWEKPVMIIVGLDDVLYPYSLEMAKVQPKARVMVMDDVNHGSAAIHPHGFNRAVLEFLEEAGAGERPGGYYYLPKGMPLPEPEARTIAELESLFSTPGFFEAIPHVVDRLVWALIR